MGTRHQSQTGFAVSSRPCKGEEVNPDITGGVGFELRLSPAGLANAGDEQPSCVGDTTKKKGGRRKAAGKQKAFRAEAAAFSPLRDSDQEKASGVGDLASAGSSSKDFIKEVRSVPEAAVQQPLFASQLERLALDGRFSHAEIKALEVALGNFEVCVRTGAFGELDARTVIDSVNELIAKTVDGGAVDLLELITKTVDGESSRLESPCVCHSGAR